MHADRILTDLVNRAVERELNVVEFFHQHPWIDVNDADALAAATEMLRGDPTAFGLDLLLNESPTDRTASTEGGA